VTGSREPRLLIVGGLSIDTITDATGDTQLAVPGGNAIYAAIGARMWGVSPRVVGLVGDDYPSAWLDELSQAGIDATGVQRVPGPHQNRFAVRYRADGEREPHVPATAFAAAGLPLPAVLERMAELLSTDGNTWRTNDETRTVAWRTRPDAVPPDIRDADACLIVPAALDRQIEWVAATLDWLPADAPVLLDPEEEQGRVLTTTDLQSVLTGVDVVMPSLRQIAGLLVGQSLTGAARLLTSLGPRIAAIKLGAEGCLVYDAAGDWERRISPVPTEVRDTTGAGDAFCGGFAAGYLRTHDAFEAALFGTVSASYAIEGYGAFAGLPSDPAEAQHRLQSLRARSIQATSPAKQEGLSG
jgi:sugar/nucleoside kinase (ribokinase family)